MKCVDCNKEVGPGKVYCPYCGGEMFRNAEKQRAKDYLSVYWFKRTME
ncbi:MAG TPA: hypothetical protein VHY08_20270 [Bacillota bacterium]|nr:hypothetical protein [Bacillota bacterium]